MKCCVDVSTETVLHAVKKNFEKTDVSDYFVTPTKDYSRNFSLKRQSQTSVVLKSFFTTV